MLSSSYYDVVAVTITPFSDGGEIDEAGFRRHLRRLAEAQVAIYLAGSGSGEALGLSEEERGQVFAIARDELGPDAPLRYAAFEARTATEFLRTAAQAAPFGFNAIRLTVPDLGHGHLPTPAEAEGYLAEVLDAVGTDVSLVIGHTGPSPAIVSTLAKRFGNLVGFEVVASDAATLLAYIRAADGRPVLVPAINHAPSALALGAAGIFGPQINLTPRLHRRFVDLVRAGDLGAAGVIYRRLIGVQELLKPHGTVVPIKAALSAFGLPAGRPRPPRRELGAAETSAIAAGLTALGIPDAEGW